MSRSANSQIYVFVGGHEEPPPLLVSNSTTTSRLSANALTNVISIAVAQSAKIRMNFLMPSKLRRGAACNQLRYGEEKHPPCYEMGV